MQQIQIKQHIMKEKQAYIRKAKLDTIALWATVAAGSILVALLAVPLKQSRQSKRW